jgi:Fe-S-cluster containining protein
MSEHLEFVIPSLRHDVEVQETDNDRFPWVIRDDKLEQSIGLDPLGKLIVDNLDQPRNPVDILGYAHAHGEGRLDPHLLWRHVSHLAQHGVLEGQRAEHIRRVSEHRMDPLEDVGADELPMAFVAGLQHACQACGSCCSATDVGPIPDNIVDSIRSVDWRKHIVGLRDNDDLFREGVHDGKSVVLTQMRHDQCVFLSDDKLCLIHQQLGVEYKPSPCRQFPYVFARSGDRIDVSLQMECRAYWQAKQAATPPSESQDELRLLLEGGAPVHVLPPVLSVDSGFMISRDEYLTLESSIIEAMLGADDRGEPMGVLAAYGLAAKQALATLYQTVDDEERTFVSRAQWRRLFPDAFEPDADPWENFLNTLGRFHDETMAFTQQAIKVANEKGLNNLANRYRFFERSIRAICKETDPNAFRISDPAAIREILKDILTSALFAKEAVRRGTLQFGLALVGMRALLVFYGACQRAREACRVEVHVQDVIDSMVTTSKMLRDPAVHAYCQGIEKPLINLFLMNLGVFTGTCEPTLTAPGGIR